MLLGLHGCSIMHTNLLTEIRVAKDAGYDAIDLRISKLERYLDVGYRAEELLPALGGLQPAALSSLDGIECQEPEARRELCRRCERLSMVAGAIHCPVIQVIALDGLKGEPWPEMRTKVARSLAELADIAGQFGVRLSLEPVVVSPLRTLAQAREVVDLAARANVGLGVDTFHLWAAGTTCEEVAALDRELIVSAHIGEATPRKGKEWTDDDRGALPGDGVVPLKEWIAAIRETGYDHVWTLELYSPYHWEWEPSLLARELKRHAEALLMP